MDVEDGMRDHIQSDVVPPGAAEAQWTRGPTGPLCMRTEPLTTALTTGLTSASVALTRTMR